MATTIHTQKLLDNANRALIKYVITSDGSQLTNAMLVDVSMLQYALTANNLTVNTSSNADIKTSYSTSIKRVFGAIASTSGYVKLIWDGANNDSDIAALAGTFDFNFESMGGIIRNPQSSSNGDILMTTKGLSANDSATLFIDIRKSSNDFRRV